ncbi:DUF115 domain-containing protein [candidate division KSB1 bacterium]|nr:DUF115 domain-containing protein [candidate division KSB1 bacterium]
MMPGTSYRRFASYELQAARSGALTAVHIPSGLHIHSGVDPVAEAADIADSLVTETSGSTLLIGFGLGYLAQAIAKLLIPPASLTVIEPDPALAALADLAARREPALAARTFHLLTSANPVALAEALADLVPESRVMIAPYCAALARVEATPFSELMIALQSERASATVYNPLLKSVSIDARHLLDALPAWTDLRIDRHKTMCVVGAGPSLDASVSALREHRAQLSIIAVSGACPALAAAGLNPDAVVVLERLPAAARDLADVTEGTPLIVFMSTNESVLSAHHRHCFRGDSNVEPLQARGGTSVVPALDFAIAANPPRIVLIGVDLGQGTRPYAAHCKRSASGNTGLALAPRYRAMRFALESLLDSRAAAPRVFHVLPQGRELRGTCRVAPLDLHALLSQSTLLVSAHA